MTTIAFCAVAVHAFIFGCSFIVALFVGACIALGNKTPIMPADQPATDESKLMDEANDIVNTHLADLSLDK